MTIKAADFKKYFETQRAGGLNEHPAAPKGTIAWQAGRAQAAKFLKTLPGQFFSEYLANLLK